MIEVIQVLDRITGNTKAHDILVQVVDSGTLLALSGGTSPDFRKMLVEGADILPGAVCVVDERFGMPYHDDSNELLLKNAGVLDFYHARDIGVYKILIGEDIQRTAQAYNLVIADLLIRFAKRVGVMGIGENLHTAGIFPNSEATHSANLVVNEIVNDIFPNRISLSLRAFGEFQTFIILAFGEEKKEVLKKVLDENENDMQKYPAIFYRKCLAKSYLITDQKII